MSVLSVPSVAQRLRALATDGDGTLVRDGKLAPATEQALERLRDAGFLLILATGETRSEVEEFPHLKHFHAVVAENGGLLCFPSLKSFKPLGPKPPARLINMLKQQDAKPLHVGEVIVSTEKPYERVLADALAELRLDYKIHRNRKEFMALPTGIDKGAGLRAIAQELGLKCNEVVAVGDAENDIPLLNACGFGVAVANALARVKAKAEHVTHAGCGQGIVELADLLLSRRRLNRTA